MSQTAHTQSPAVAIEGMEADCSLAKDRISGVATMEIPFGHFVSATGGGGDDPYTVELPDASAKVTDGRGLGVAIADVSIESADGTGDGYEDDASLAIMRRGRIWVVSEDAVAAIGTPAFVRFAAGAGGSVLGAFRTDADTATAVALPGARFMSTTSGTNQLALLEITPQT